MGQMTAQTDSGLVSDTARVGVPSTSQIEDAGTFRVITKEFNIEISLLGGRIISAGLENYKQDQDTEVDKELVFHVEGSAYPLGISNGEVSDLWTEYRIVSPANLRRDGGALKMSESTGDKVVVMRGNLSDGREVTKKLTFRPDGFIISADFTLSQADASASPLLVSWTKFVSEEDGAGLDPYKAAGFAWFDGQKAKRQTFPDIEQNVEDLGKVKWLTIGDKYFAAIFIAAQDLQPAKYTKLDRVYSGQLLGNSTRNEFDLFLGPKSYRLFNDIGYELQRNIDFGFFGIVSAPLLSLLHLLFGVFKNYGLAIVALTIIVRMALFPLNSASFKQMKAMQDLKPELDKLRETVKDKQQQQVALMELYKKKGVNPLGGCLPMFLQMPIFIGLYAALLLSVELRHAHFAGWITDLSGPEQLMIGGIGIPVMVILFVISMVVQQLTTPSTMDPTQKKVMMVMPVVMGFIFASMPAGLTLYWLTSNLISIGQHKAMHHREGDPKAALKITLAVSAGVFVLACFVVLIG
jgi:YidC/Oxa1 family membrane protein insertase